MKRVIWFICLFMLAFGVVGCGDDEQKAESNNEAKSEKELAEEKERFILTIERHKYQLQEDMLDLSNRMIDMVFAPAFNNDSEEYIAEMEAIQQRLDQGLSEIQNMHVPDDQVAQEAYDIYLDIITGANKELNKMIEAWLEFDLEGLFQFQSESNNYVIKWERFDEIWAYYKEKD